jgi:hypothetical protein
VRGDKSSLSVGSLMSKTKSGNNLRFWRWPHCTIPLAIQLLTASFIEDVYNRPSSRLLKRCWDIIVWQ